MANREEGIVTRVEENIAYVKPTDPALCKKCALSAMCAMNSSQEIKMINVAGAKENDNVYFDLDIDELNIRFIKFLVFALFMFLAGLLIGYIVGRQIGFQKEVLSVLGGGLFLFFVYFIYKKKDSKEKNLPKIVEIQKED